MKCNGRERESIRHFLTTVIVFMFCAVQFPLCPLSADASITTTKHNLSSSGTGSVKATSETRICVFCHTPHNAITGVPPLWNHTLSAASYTVPSSSMPAWTSLLSTPQNPPDGDSRLCLSCHDGTVAIGSVVNLGGLSTTIQMQGGLNYMTGGALLGTDLSGHHPVSIEVDNALLADKDTQCINGEISFRVCDPQTPIVLRPTNNQYGSAPHTGKGMQCSSCHDAHSSNEDFLRAGTPSDLDPLCTKCHISCLDTCP
jgi:predicted CXXCH cytochrome family protein